MSKRHRRHGQGPGQGAPEPGPVAHGPEGHGPHHELDAQDPKPPGEVITPPPPTPGEDINLRVVVRFAAVLATAVGVVSLLVGVFIWKLADRAAAKDPSTPPPPGNTRPLDVEYGQDLARPDGGVRLQRQPFADLDQTRADEAQVLEQYGWVDAAAGIVRIPIEEAMKLVVQRGLPTRAEYAPMPLSTPAPAPGGVEVLPTPRPRPAAPRPTRRPIARTPAPTAEPTPEGGA